MLQNVSVKIPDYEKLMFERSGKIIDLGKFFQSDFWHRFYGIIEEVLDFEKK